MPVSLSAVTGEVVKLSTQATLSLCCSQTLRSPAPERDREFQRKAGHKKRGMVGLTDTGDRWRDIRGKVHNSSACL